MDMHLVDVPIILVMVGAFLVLAALAVIIRQIVVSRPRGAFECTLWRRSRLGREVWQSGLMRFGADRLRWYRASSVRFTPQVVIARAELADLVHRPIDLPVEGLEDYVLVEFARTERPMLRAIVPRQSASALIAWYEAAPMGGVRGDAD